MSRARIEPHILIPSCARATADGHLRVRQPAGAGLYTTISLASGVAITNFDTACAWLEALLQAAFPAGGFTVTPGTDSATIAAGAAFDLVWTDTDVRSYFGFASASYLNTSSLASDTGPAGRFTSTLAADCEFFDRLVFQTSTSHGGTTGGVYLARHEGETLTLTITAAEIDHFVRVLGRLKCGNRARVWLDSTTATSFDWTATDWTGYRVMALHDPSNELDLSDWLGSDNELYRRVSLKLVEVL